MTHSPRFAFFGTPEFSVKILDILDSHGLTPVVIITAPDKERGRGLKVSPTPVKKWSTKRQIPVLTPEKLKGNKEFLEQLREFNLDVSVVAAYGLIIPLMCYRLLVLAQLMCTPLYFPSIEEHRL
jgi:methionyl-tRNA formyltransferase